MRTRSLYVVTGVSGSGKSTAISAFEDLGFSCVENLPAQMIGDYARYLESGGELHRPEVPGYALLLDCRDIESSKTVIKELKRLQSLGVAVFVLFLDCQDDVILRPDFYYFLSQNWPYLILIEPYLFDLRFVKF